MNFKDDKNIMQNIISSRIRDEIEELPEIVREWDEIDYLPDLFDEEDEIDRLPEVDTAEDSKEHQIERNRILLKHVDQIFADGGVKDENHVEISEKVKEIVRYCNPLEMVKTVAYFVNMRVTAKATFIYEVADHYSGNRLDDTIIGDVISIYKDLITPRYIKDHFGNTLLDPAHVVSKLTEFTCQGVEAAQYLGWKAFSGGTKIVENAITFSAATVAHATGNPEMAERLYKTDFAGMISRYVDEYYDGNELIKEIGKYAEKVGEIGTYLGLTVLTAGESAIVAGIATAGIGLARAGEATRAAVEKTGEYTNKELVCGIITGVAEAASRVMFRAISVGEKEILNKWEIALSKLDKPELIRENISRYIVDKAVKFTVVGTGAGIHTALFEGGNAVKDYVTYAVGIDDELELDLKKIAKHAGIAALAGGTIYTISDMANEIYGFVVEKVRKTELYKNYIENLKQNSEFPETIKGSINTNDLYKRSPEETKQLREEFSRNKNKLIEEWEKQTGRIWPVYEKDIMNEYGEVVRKKGWKYDAHHIHPLALGGENTAQNITPLRYDVHSDHKGVHASGSAYDMLEKFLRQRSA